jgi:hypothetical protein
MYFTFLKFMAQRYCTIINSELGISTDSIHCKELLESIVISMIKNAFTKLDKIDTLTFLIFGMFGIESYPAIVYSTDSCILARFLNQTGSFFKMKWSFWEMLSKITFS